MTTEISNSKPIAKPLYNRAHSDNDKDLCVAAARYVTAKAHGAIGAGYAWVKSNLGPHEVTVYKWDSTYKATGKAVMPDEQLLKLLPELQDYTPPAARIKALGLHGTDVVGLVLAYLRYIQKLAPMRGQAVRITTTKFSLSKEHLYSWTSACNTNKLIGGRTAKPISEAQLLAQIPEDEIKQDLLGNIRQRHVGRKRSKRNTEKRNTTFRDTTRTIAEEFQAAPVTHPAQKANKPKTAPIPEESAFDSSYGRFVEYFSSRKAFCPGCGQSNAAGFLKFLEHNPNKEITNFHCIGCGASLSSALSEHYGSNDA